MLEVNTETMKGDTMRPHRAVHGSKQRLLEKLDTGWAAFKNAYAGLSHQELMAPGVTGDWSVKDILAHVSTWEAEALKYLPVVIAGRRPPRYVKYGGIDGFNATMTDRKRDLSLATVLKQLDDTHRHLVDLVRRAPEAQFTADTRFRRRLRLETYGHYPEHAEAIRQWRQQRAREHRDEERLPAPKRR